MNEHTLLDFILELLHPVVVALDDHYVEAYLVRELGYVLPEDVTVLGGMRSVFTSFMEAIRKLGDLSADTDPVEHLEVLLSVLVSVRSVLEAVGDLASFLDRHAADSEFVKTTDVLNALPQRLIDYLVSRAIYCRFPAIHGALSFAGVIEERLEESEGDEYRVSFVEQVIHWGQLSLVFSDFFGLLKTLYGFSTNNLAVSSLFDRLHKLAFAVGLDAEFDAADSRAIVAFNAAIGDDSGEVEDTDDLRILRIPFVPLVPWLLACEIYPVLSSTGGVDGTAVGVHVHPDLDLTLPISEELSLAIGLSSEAQLGFGIIARAGRDIVFVTSVFEDEPGDLLEHPLEARVTFDYRPLSGGIIFGATGITHLEIGSISTSLGATRHQSGMCEFYVEFEISQAALIVLAGQGDGFLRKSLPEDSLRIEFDLVFGLSSQRGIYVGGGAGLEFTSFINAKLGPLFVEMIRARLNADDEGVKLAIALTGGLNFGPLAATIHDIGLEACLQFDKPGFLGTADVCFGFKPPTGVGLAVDAAGISGGGFLEFDEANGRYFGALSLNFGEIGLAAMGLITTKLPDGSEGFALLISIGITFTPPIQLGMGFTLSGVGGLIGINRSMDIDALRAGFRQRALAGLLFPDPTTVVANASQLLTGLEAIFPTAEGRFVIAPMVKIGWGSGNLLTGEVGIFFELPDPVRIALLGQVQAALPTQDKALVRIQLDVLGVIDMDREELTFQASLYDSRILTFALSGDAAFLLGWGRNPRFALSMGGFHPKFKPPEPAIVFGRMGRLSLDLNCSGLQLGCTSYLALTPNSLQFGAQVNLHASAGPLSVEGHLGFDALFYFSPFWFEVEIRGGVELEFEGATLLGVGLTLLLSGPTPWHARGKARIKILFISISVGFSFTWGSDEQAVLDAVDPGDFLLEALSAPQAWSGVLPAGRPVVESLRSIEESADDAIVVHPAGRLEVRQSVVPLGEPLAKFGNAPIASNGHNWIDIDTEEGLQVDGEKLTTTPVMEHFARGQYEDLTPDQRLSLPSFDLRKGGVISASWKEVKHYGPPVDKKVKYESSLLERDGTSQPQEGSGEFSWDVGHRIVGAAAFRRAGRRAGPRKKFGPLRSAPRVSWQETTYCIVNAATLKPEEGQENRGLSRAAADALLAAQQAAGLPEEGDLMVVPEYEVPE